MKSGRTLHTQAVVWVAGVGSRVGCLAHNPESTICSMVSLGEFFNLSVPDCFSISEVVIIILPTL